MTLDNVKYIQLKHFHSEKAEQHFTLIAMLLNHQKTESDSCKKIALHGYRYLLFFLSDFFTNFGKSSFRL